MTKFKIELASGESMFTDEDGHHALKNVAGDAAAAFVSIAVYGRPSDDNPSRTVEVNAHMVTVISPSGAAG